MNVTKFNDRCNAVRLVERNRERFAKRIRAGTRARGTLILATDGSDETVRLRRVLETARALVAELGRKPSVDEIAARSGLSPEHVRHALALARIMQR